MALTDIWAILGKADYVEDEEEDVGNYEEHFWETGRILADLISIQLQILFIHLLLDQGRGSLDCSWVEIDVAWVYIELVQYCLNLKIQSWEVVSESRKHTDKDQRWQIEKKAYK